jgi:hypothetical protein
LLAGAGVARREAGGVQEVEGDARPAAAAAAGAEPGVDVGVERLLKKSTLRRTWATCAACITDCRGFFWLCGVAAGAADSSSVSSSSISLKRVMAH